MLPWPFLYPYSWESFLKDMATFPGRMREDDPLGIVGVGCSTGLKRFNLVKTMGISMVNGD
jgi:hypothetical protein